MIELGQGQGLLHSRPGCIILIFHQCFGILDTLLSLNTPGLHFLDQGLECREPWLGFVMIGDDFSWTVH